MGKKYKKSKGYKKTYKKNRNYNNSKISDSDIGITIGVIVTIVISIILKIGFWLLVIGFFGFTLFLVYKIFISIIGNNIKSILIILILIFDLIGGIVVFERQEVVYQKIDNIASDIGGFFGYKRGKIIIDNEAGIEGMMKSDLIENLDNK